IIQERIEREFNIELITTATSVVYEVEQTDGTMIEVDNPSMMTEPQHVQEIREPFVQSTIMVTHDSVDKVMEVDKQNGGQFVNMEYLYDIGVNVIYDMLLSEIVYDFFDQLKSHTKGYASFDYEPIGYRPSNLIKMDILLNREKIDALSFIVHRDFAYERGK